MQAGAIDVNKRKSCTSATVERLVLLRGVAYQPPVPARPRQHPSRNRFALAVHPNKGRQGARGRRQGGQVIERKWANDSSCPIRQTHNTTSYLSRVQIISTLTTKTDQFTRKLLFSQILREFSNARLPKFYLLDICLCPLCLLCRD